MSLADVSPARAAGALDIFAYAPRRLHADPVVSVNGWQMKPYRILAPGVAAVAPPITDLIAQAVPPSHDPGFHGVGFAMIHVGRDGSYFLAGRWYGGHNLASEAFRIVKEGGGWGLERLSLLACVWELAVHAFEREAWMRAVMMSGRGLDGVPDYLASRQEGLV